MQALVNARVLTPEGYKDKQSVVFEDGVIVAVCDDESRSAKASVLQDLGGRELIPGFVDVQVNGGGGVLFNDCPTVDGIKTIGDAHRKFGTTGFFPTLISADLDIMARAIEAVNMAIQQGIPGVLGIHLEGPFLNVEKCGVHDPSKFIRIGSRELALMSSLEAGKTIITLAPEKTTPDIIRALTARGVIVCAGHTQASYKEAIIAMEAGLTGFTHLFNAMRAMESRRPGIIAAALEDKRGWCGIIADGHHVDWAMLRLALRAKVGDQTFLVTDAMPSVGAVQKGFSIGGENIIVKDGKCITADGRLAGSDLDMISAVLNAVEYLDIDFSQAVRMASILPARFVNMQDRLGEICVGLQADFTLLSVDQKVEKTWIKGQSIS